jgi:hypothetical protein
LGETFIKYGARLIGDQRRVRYILRNREKPINKYVKNNAITIKQWKAFSEAIYEHERKSTNKHLTILQKKNRSQ